MRNYILIMAFSCSFSALHALAVMGTKPYSRQDTLQAVQRLFDRKRSSGRSCVMVGSVNVACGVIALPVGASVAAVGLCTTSFGLIRQRHFSVGREEALLNAYLSGAALPKRIQRRLKANYFL